MPARSTKCRLSPLGATIHGPGEGEVHDLGPSRLELKAVSEDTDGKFSFSEVTVGPGYEGPQLHVHEFHHETIYVLDGTLSMRVGEEWLEAGPGTFICVEPGTPHTASNPTDAPVRFLNLAAPGGFELYMRELGAAMRERGGAIEPAEGGTIAARYEFKAV